MSFNILINKRKLKKKATSNKKVSQVFSSIGLDNVDTNLWDGPLSNDVGIVNLHPSKETHCVVYINDNFFDACGFAPPQKLSNLIKKQNGPCLFSEYKIQGLTGIRNFY